MSKGALRLSLFLAAAALSIGAPRASAQNVYGHSSLSIGFSEVTSYSETDLDYLAESYYDVETDAYLWVNSSIAASGSSSGSSGQSVSLETATAINTGYYVQTNHWVIPITGTPFCFSCLSAEWWAGSMSVTAVSGSDSGSVYVGTTYDSGNTDGSAPAISGADYTTYGTEMPGTSGYVILYGSNFTTPYGSTTVSSGFGSASYVSATQINLYYSIPAGASPGTYTNDISVSTPYGAAYANFYVY
jgi:hypothetical protein